ncbi:MAG: tRNA lysidine(34) synthetase TilS [Phycisphaerales bacterium]|nr:MAG: tRNA lysidine(34) synthetase TilS [Phycisphaerales bacterium]
MPTPHAPPDPVTAALRADPACRRIIAAWRRLTGGRDVRDAQRRTLVACSAGTDSSCLAIALASAAPGSVVLAHVRHDLRPAPEADRDRDAAEALARRLGTGIAHADATVRETPGNAEANARQARERALAALAITHECLFVATGHHADDQLETAIMRLLRGSGPRGLAGVRERRRLQGDRGVAAGASPGATGVTLVRPMLSVTREDAARLCAMYAHEPVHDATNSDRTRLRARLRADVTPRLREIAPRGAARAAEAQRLAGEAHQVVQDAAEALLAEARRAPAQDARWALDRTVLRSARPVVVAELLRSLAVRMGEGLGADRLAGRTLRAAAERITGPCPEPARYVWRHVIIELSAHEVLVRRKERT